MWNSKRMMLPVSKNGIMLPHRWRTKSVLEIIGMAFSAFICCFETPLNWRSHYDHVLFSCLISFTFLWLQLHKTLHLHYHTEMHLNLSTRFPQYQCERLRCQGCCNNQVALTWNNTLPCSLFRALSSVETDRRIFQKWMNFMTNYIYNNDRASNAL